VGLSLSAAWPVHAAEGDPAEPPPPGASVPASPGSESPVPLAPGAASAPDGQKPGFLAKFRDPEDGEIDLSKWLLESKGFLPVPIIITEPAVGYGGGLMALFFRQSMSEAAAASAGKDRLVPPEIYAVGGAKTENGTWAGVAGGMVSFQDDEYRWRGGVARLNVNLDFYGAGGQRGPLAYTMDGWASVQHAMMRLGKSDWWAIARWNYMDLDNQFNFGGDEGIIGPISKASRASGLGVSLEEDSRDNIFTPSRGTTGALDLTFYDPAFGSDTSFESYRAHVFGYWPVGRTVVIAGRADVRAAEGRVPFYMLPYVDLRGVPVGRLQDTRTAVFETEVRWNVTPRWAAIGFVGNGRAWGTSTDFSNGHGTWGEGVGFRYLIARRLGMYIGIDAAHSDFDTAYYLQVGSAWR
jgi:hypothetical protein